MTKSSEYCLKWRGKNKDSYLAYQREYSRRKSYKDRKNAYCKMDRALHPEKYKIALRSKKDEILCFVNRLKCGPCLDCKRTFNPWVMQFDHRDPSTKIASISMMAQRKMSLAIIQTEIVKCDLVCANCHAERTHRRRCGL